MASRFNQFMQKSLLFLLDYAEYDMVSAWETMARIYSHSSVYIFYDHYGKDDSQPKEEYSLEFEEDPNAPQVTVRIREMVKSFVATFRLTLTHLLGVHQVGLSLFSLKRRVVRA